MKYICYIFFLAVSFSALGQGGATCADIQPFCADETGNLQFDNVYDDSPSEPGLDYGCLFSQPNPAWYYLQIAEEGDLQFTIYQTDTFGSPIDVDFIAWGPFASYESCGSANLNSSTEVDCSYSGSATESFTISNAQVGEIYILLITNFDGDQGSISLSQTNLNGGPTAGSTDCSILTNLGEDQDLCDGESTSLDGTIEGGQSYQWFYDDSGVGSNYVAITGETTPELIINDPVGVNNDASGQYKIEVIDEFGDLTIDEVIVTFHAPPTVPAAGTISMLEACVNDGGGYGVFDLTVREDDILNGQTGVTVTYFSSFSGANSETPGSSQILAPTSYENTDQFDQDIYVRLENDDLGCYSVTSFTIHVEAPESIADMYLCDEVTLDDGIESFDLSTQIPLILDGMNANDFTIEFYESQPDLASGTSEITNYTSYSNSNPFLQTVFVKLINNFTGCSVVKTFSLIVVPLPEPVQPSPLYACDDDGDGYTLFLLNEKNDEILDGQTGVNVFYYATMAELEAGGNPLPSNYTNTSTPSQTLYVLLINLDSGCSNTTTLEIRVADNPVANVPDALEFCDPDNDGYGIFDIESVNNEVIPNDGMDYNVTYHETQTDAENGINEFYSMYENILPDTQTMYVRVENSESHCYDVVPLQLIVYPTPIVPVNLDDLEICDDNVADGYAEFDLSLQNASVYGSQSTADFTITYHASLTTAENGTGALPQYYTNIYPFQQTIYVRLENNTTGCYTTREFDLIVHPNPVVNPDYDNDLSLCDDFGEPGDELLIFDLTVENDEVTGDVNGYAVSYYHTSADAQSGNNQIINDTAYQNTVNPETLYVRVEDVNTGCTSFTTVTLRVLNNPTPLADIEPQETCDDDTDGDENNGQAVFDLTIDELAILNGEGGVTPVYYETYEDAFDGVNAIADPTAYYNITPYLQTIYIRVTNDVTGCYTITTFDLIVHPLPAVTDAPVYYLCEYDNDYVETFPLTDMDSFVMDGGDTNDLEITYYNTLADAEDDTAELVGPNITVNGTRAIFARVYDEIYGCVQTVAYTIEIRQAPLANKPEPVALCDVEHELADGTIVPINDGIEIFDLTAVIDEIRGVQDPGTYEVSLYTSASDALDGINALEADEIVAYETTTTTLYALVTNVNTGCTNGDPIAVELYVEPLGEVVLTQTGSEVLCIDVTNNPIIGTDLGAGYSYLWNTGATTATIEITEGGEYFVEVINTNTINQCSYTSNTVVYQEASLPGVTPRVIQSEAFQGEDTIAVIAEGAGVSEYSYTLETGESNTTGIFTNVAPGFHTITITELNGCGSLAIQVSVIDYMRYFTPNGDGVNDKWRIIGLESQENAQVYIFDRQGKLIKQIAATSEGWNGTFNGTIMPSNDYWFKVVYTEPTTGEVKEFTNHFTLKR